MYLTYWIGQIYLWRNFVTKVLDNKDLQVFFKVTSSENDSVIRIFYISVNLICVFYLFLCQNLVTNVHAER